MDRLETIRAERDKGRALGELFDMGYSADEIVRALGGAHIWASIGVPDLEQDEPPDGDSAAPLFDHWGSRL